MKKTMNRVLAVTLASTMILGSAMTVFATESDVTGTGTVEYDDSTPVIYDKVQVPTITGSTAYNMQLDPAGLLKKYDPETFAANKTVYFNKTTTAEQIDADKSGGEVTPATDPVTYNGVYKEVVTAKDAVPSTLVTEVTLAEGEVTGVVSIAASPKYAVWVPDTASEDANNKGLGKLEPITKDNVLDYFDVTATAATTITAVTAKVKNLSGQNIFDGKIYEITYEKLSGKVNAADYVTLTYSNGVASVGTVNSLYDKDGTKISAGDIVLEQAVKEYTDQSDSVTVTNKSTKKKTVTATITLNNATGLTIKDDDTFTSDTDASIYVAATNGTDTEVLAESDGKITAVYTVDLEAPTLAEITYQSTELNTDKLGGHKYLRYEPYGATYSSDSFYITAAVNKQTDDTDAAWKAYYKDATVAPTLKVVYSVADFVAAPDNYTVTFDSKGGSDVASATVAAGGNATAPSDPTKADNSFGGWYTSEDEGTTLSDAAFDFANTAINADITLYAKWTPYEVGMSRVLNYQGTVYLALEDEEGNPFATDATFTKVVVNDIDVTDKAANINGFIAITASDLAGAGVEVGAGKTFVSVYTVEGVTYKSSFTNN